MKPFPLIAVLAALPFSILSAAGPEKGTLDRQLTPFETSLVGAWFTSGNPDKRSYIASSGSKLFTINEVKDTLELVGSNVGSVVAKRPGYETTGVVSGDFILWSNGTWWARHPVPPPPDDLVIWNDPGSGWTLLKSTGRPAMSDAKISWRWDSPDGPRVGGKPYRPDQFLSAHAPSDFKFVLEKPITEFRAVIGLIEGGRLGSVVFKLKTDAGLVFTSDEIRHDRGDAQSVVLKFAPTKTLELITESGENNYEDWSIWLMPEVK